MTGRLMTRRPMTGHAHVVARVGDRTVTTDDLDARLAAIRSGPLGPRLPEDDTASARRLRCWVAGLLASETLIRHEAARLLPAAARPDPPSPGSLAATASHLFTHVTADVTVDESELRRYYDANPDLWTRPERRTLRQALRPHAHQAAALRPEDLGPPESLTRGQFTGPLEDAVFAARPGDRIGPVHTAFGWHLAVLDHVEPARTLPYPTVRPTIHADLLAAARGSAFDDWLTLRRAALVRLAPGYEHPGDPNQPDHVHRH
ncbi:peptidyl-prolyl cis-trans isomerase [Kitasatospora sp. LaBMicrA B282]|uniref:peptidylprolyl isomerase n=1 Tax=Kitasatospora sp. LaBMicrA B282 TaxID=3420949 RepID=UPI003D142238